MSGMEPFITTRARPPGYTDLVLGEQDVRVGPEGHLFRVTEFAHPRFYSVAATLSISPSSRAQALRRRGLQDVDWLKHGLYSIGAVSPIGLVSVWEPAVSGRMFPRRVKETYLLEVARAIGFTRPVFVGKPEIAAGYVPRRIAESAQVHHHDLHVQREYVWQHERV